MRTGKKSRFRFTWETCDPHKCFVYEKKPIALSPYGDKIGFCSVCNNIVYWR